MCCMIACLQPGDQFFEENKMTLEYAALAAQISNKPVKNDDPLTMQITELKGQVKILTMELMKANQHIELLSALCGQQVKKFGAGLIPEASKKLEPLNRQSDVLSFSDASSFT
jgi:hypothetical protein